MSADGALKELARLTGQDRLDESLAAVVAAYTDYRRRHPPGSTRATEAEAETLAGVGVNLSVLDDADDPGVYLAGASAAILSDTLTVAEAAGRLDLTPTRIRQRLTSDPPTLLGMRVNGGQWRLPAFQFAQGAAVALRGGDAIAALPATVSIRRVDALFTRPNDTLRDHHDQPMSPMAWLAEGHDLEPVVELAAGAAMVP